MSKWNEDREFRFGATFRTRTGHDFLNAESRIQAAKRDCFRIYFGVELGDSMQSDSSFTIASWNVLAREYTRPVQYPYALFLHIVVVRLVHSLRAAVE
jgi:hypothetical protein